VESLVDDGFVCIGCFLTMHAHEAKHARPATGVRTFVARQSSVKGGRL
jgi:hypothetical protein